MSTFMPNEQWDIVYAVTRPHVVRYDCCPESYPDVTFVIGLKRKPLYYVYNVVLPCVLLTALSLVGFNMPFNIGVVKVSLGVMLLLSLGVFNLQVSQTMPKTSEEISLLGEYFAATMVLISLSVAMNVAVLNINEWGKNGTYDVPGWIRVFVMQYMAMFMCVKQCYSVNTLAIDGDKNNERNGKGKKGGGNLSSGNIESGTGTFENGSPCLSHSTTFYAQPDTADNSVLPIDPSYRRGQVWLPRDNDGSQDNYKNKKNLVVHHEGLRGLENSCRNTLSAPMIALTEIPPPPSPPPPPNAQINPQFTSVPCAPPKRRLCDCKQETKLSKFTYTSHPPPRLERHVEQIAELIKRPQQFSERRRQIEYDWMVVATTVDRFLLALFLICSVIFTITFLAQRPGNMEPPEEAYAIDYEY
uniref:Neuronal acetylcholine receptor subunit alpha-9-II-like n=1 Tax=Saccoglossus kowalevskii TaxID=10224 RepID=A0ABM0MPQ5_SACKO|nr:PREDICTED: neuronal acetylcholine receptor subunit alpha-9-II-like [Saccoglossus kowalevskii]